MKEINYYKIVGILFTALCIGLVGLVLSIGKFEHEINVTNDKVSVSVDSIYFEDIDSIELLSDLYIGDKIKGTSTPSYLRGTFRLDDDIYGKVYVHKKSSPYIRITSNDKILVCNLEESEETINTYESILEKVDIEGSKVISDISIEQKRDLNKDNMVEIAIYTIPSVVFVGLGISCFNRKTPVGFWSGVSVKSEEIIDINGYNRANGILWICVGIAVLGLPYMIDRLGIGIMILFPTVFLLSIIYAYKRIYKKYSIDRK